MGTEKGDESVCCEGVWGGWGAGLGKARRCESTEGGR